MNKKFLPMAVLTNACNLSDIDQYINQFVIGITGTKGRDNL